MKTKRLFTEKFTYTKLGLEISKEVEEFIEYLATKYGREVNPRELGHLILGSVEFPITCLWLDFMDGTFTGKFDRSTNSWKEYQDSK